MEYQGETLEGLVKAINGLANAINSKVDNNVTMIQGILDYLEGIDGPHERYPAKVQAWLIFLDRKAKER